MLKDGLYWAEQLKTKKISVEELLQATSDRIEKENPTLNAIVETHFEVPFPKKKGPFAGVPIALKMLGQNKAGWPATSGSRLLRKNVAHLTDNYVKAIEAAGFLPVAQTNAPEFGFKNVTDPVLYGVAHNPWNLDYTPGGSSGGAAAAVAAGFFPLACASDGGGSIRIPASFCGLVGLKPTRGVMPIGPSEWRSWQGASTAFALTVSMRDTEALFYHMRTSQQAAAYQAPKVEWQHTGRDRSKHPLKIAYTTESPVSTPVSDAAKQMIKAAVGFLSSLGHEVKEVAYPLAGRPLMEAYYLMNGAETAAMFSSVPKADIEPMSWALYQYGLKIPAAALVQSLNDWDAAAFQMETLFEDYDLFLTPTTAESAPRIETDFQSPTIRSAMAHAEELSEAELATLVYDMFAKSLVLTPFTQLANLTGQPAISLPTGLADNGLPLGIQFQASKGRENLLLRIGYEFEEAGKFHLPRFYH